ncbi:hypothetical protein L9F63_020795, partial [Diploptera punctata]
INRFCLSHLCAETVMGVEINAQGQETTSEYEEAESKATWEFSKRVMSPWLYPDFLYKLSPGGRRFKKHVNTMHTITAKVIRDRRMYNTNEESHMSSEKRYSGNNGKASSLALMLHIRNQFKFKFILVNVESEKKKLIFLDLLLETSQNGIHLTDEEIKDEVNTFMFGGHDTVTAAISWTLYMLAVHPDVQEKAYEELESIFQNSDRPPSMQDLCEMKYLERVMKETLRLYTIAPIIGRELQEDIELDGYILPRNAEIAIFPYLTHRLPEYYPDPDKFNPDNFLPERCATRHPYAYIPFSAGPRNCIGQKFAILEEKTVISYILRNYKLHASDHIAEPAPDIILRPLNGIKLEITPRNVSCLNRRSGATI